jgi:hypothetical protein
VVGAVVVGDGGGRGGGWGRWWPTGIADGGVRGGGVRGVGGGRGEQGGCGLARVSPSGVVYIPSHLRTTG